MTPKIAKTISQNAAQNKELVLIEMVVSRAYEKIRSDASSGSFMSLVETPELVGKRTEFVGAIRRLKEEGFSIGAYSRGMGHFFVDWNTTNKGFSVDVIDHDLREDAITSRRMDS